MTASSSCASARTAASRTTAASARSINGDRIYPRLAQLFEQADDRYNSGLFHFKKEKDRHEAPDELTLDLDLDDKLLRDILREPLLSRQPLRVLRHLPADILGQVYEQFLGKVIRLTDGHRAVVEDKPEVKKAGGVYYTPTYIVDYIVQHTVGKLLDESQQPTVARLERQRPKSTSLRRRLLPGEALRRSRRHRHPQPRRQTPHPRSRLRLRLVPPRRVPIPARLASATSTLANDPAKWAKGSKPALVQDRGGGWQLTIAERKRILLNNIYGVDIDAQAVEVTKLSLLLKVLEGETGQTLQTSLPHLPGTRAARPGRQHQVRQLAHRPGFLPAAANCRCSTDEERYRINVFDWQAEFPEIFRGQPTLRRLRLIRRGKTEPPSRPLHVGMMAADSTR